MNGTFRFPIRVNRRKQLPRAPLRVRSIREMVKNAKTSMLELDERAVEILALMSGVSLDDQQVAALLRARATTPCVAANVHG